MFYTYMHFNFTIHFTSLNIEHECFIIYFFFNYALIANLICSTNVVNPDENSRKGLAKNRVQLFIVSHSNLITDFCPLSTNKKKR